MPAEFDLERFLTAQAPVYGQALAELREGCKRSHWMWFIFPQLAGLLTATAMAGTRSMTPLLKQIFG
jgi:uncharacterized protein (DUF1810 family)